MKQSFSVHPLLFAVSPILFLYAHNMRQTPLRDIVVPLGISVSVTAVLWLAAARLLRHRQKAACLVSAGLISFFTYGHLYELIADQSVFGLIVGRHRYLLTAYGIIFFSFCARIVRSRRDVLPFTVFLNACSVVLFAIQCVTIFLRVGTRGPAVLDNTQEVVVGNPSHAPASELQPDIYYLILDGYASQGVLREFFGYDNSTFIRALQERGFVVASESRSNYASTYLSLASSLNMEYLDVPEHLRNARTDDCWVVPSAMIQHNRVQAFLRSRGYQCVHVGSGYGATARNPRADCEYLYRGLSEFERSLISTTLLVLSETLFVGEDHRRRILFNLSTLRNVPRIKHAKFVFAHLIIPHPPFLFTREGTPVHHLTFRENSRLSWRSRSQYIDQVAYLNSRLLPLIDSIIGQSTTPLVIILQADHGSASTFFGRSWSNPTADMVRERMGILNAYYVREDARKLLYQTITPVNTFRLIFSHYFGGSFPLLADRSYYSSYEDGWNMREADAFLPAGGARASREESMAQAKRGDTQ